ncbi:hypothetical protein PLICRDRAFT_693866 [Plicaturopsis crispa FD-325 SS-3]|nr:hypothetical protein PLICRDRAFT_693866 [Plicaturopsis crispa FD-325 SS-3]
MGFLTPTNVAAFPEPPEAYGWRIYFLALSASFGSAMFGYDVGFIGGAISLPSFKARFGLNASAATALSSNIVSTFLAGAFFGALFVYPIHERVGSRSGLLLAGTIFLIGSILTTVSPGLVSLIYVGRAFTGLGVGVVSLIVPVYISECAPPALRGRLVGIFECMLQLAQIIGFWINFGVSKHIANTSESQWRIPFAIQIVPAVLLLFFMAFQPESPRFLVKNGQADKAAVVLAYLRHLPEGHLYIKTEIAAVEEQLRNELAITGGDRSLKAKFRVIGEPSNLRRLGIGIALMTFLGLTGINSINYFSPLIIKGLGFTGTLQSLLATGIYGIVKASFCIASLIFALDRFGRRPALMLGSAGAAFSLFYLAIFSAVSGSFGGLSSVDAGAYVALVFIYIFAVFLAISWTGIPWIYCAEIFPAGIRPVCTVITTMTQWLVQFAIVYATPYMVKNITYGTFVFFGVCTVIGGVFVWWFVPETRGIPLEDMDILFTRKGRASQMRRETQDILAARREEVALSRDAASSLEEKV